MSGNSGRWLKEVTELIAELGSYSYSFIKTDSDHVILNAMKQMESFYEKGAIRAFIRPKGATAMWPSSFPGRFAPLVPICLRMYFRDGPAGTKPFIFV